jgi:hypothetical protein
MHETSSLPPIIQKKKKESQVDDDDDYDDYEREREREREKKIAICSNSTVTMLFVAIALFDNILYEIAYRGTITICSKSAMLWRHCLTTLVVWQCKRRNRNDHGQ